MIFLTKQMIKFLTLLHSETSTNAIALGFAFGCILGFSPIISLQGLLCLLLLLIFRIQIGSALLASLFFKFIAYLFDGQADQLGRAILENEGLNPLLSKLYNIPLVPLTRFNNSIVMGSLVVSVILAPVVFFGSKVLIRKYREVVVARVKKSAFWKAMTTTKAYTWYAKYRELYG